MKLLKRNLTPFTYRPYLRKEEIVVDGKHTGRWTAVYGDPEHYMGNMDLPNGYVQNQFFGINKDYIYILLVTRKEGNHFRETGLVEWEGDTFQIVSIRRSLNVVALTLQVLTKGDGEP